jgi:hypothetical protein
MPLQRPAYSPKTESVQGDKILAPNNTTPLTYRKGCRFCFQFGVGVALLDFFLYPLVIKCEKKASSIGHL